MYSYHGIRMRKRNTIRELSLINGDVSFTLITLFRYAILKTRNNSHIKKKLHKLKKN